MKLDEIREQLIAFSREPANQSILIFLAILYGVVWLRIFRRAGLSPVMGVLMLVPPLTFVLPIYMAFTSWPLERPILRSRQRMQAALARPPSPPPRAPIALPGNDRVLPHNVTSHQFVPGSLPGDTLGALPLRNEELRVRPGYLRSL